MKRFYCLKNHMVARLIQHKMLFSCLGSICVCIFINGLTFLCFYLFNPLNSLLLSFKNLPPKYTDTCCTYINVIAPMYIKLTCTLSWCYYSRTPCIILNIICIPMLAKLKDRCWVHICLFQRTILLSLLLHLLLVSILYILYILLAFLT